MFPRHMTMILRLISDASVPEWLVKPSFLLTIKSALDGADKETPSDVAFQSNGNSDHWHNHDQNQNGHVPPLRAARGVLGGHRQW
jgi:hypothetical protein